MANKKVKKVYEAGLHLIPTIEEGKVSSVFDEVKASVAADAEVLSEEVPERRQLAYTIRHAIRQSDGSYSRDDESYFGSIKFGASQEDVVKIKQSMQGNENILRFIILETVEEDTRIGETLPGEEVEEEEEETKKTEEESGTKEDKKEQEEVEDGVAENNDGDKK